MNKATRKEHIKNIQSELKNALVEIRSYEDQVDLIKNKLDEVTVMVENLGLDIEFDADQSVDRIVDGIQASILEEVIDAIQHFKSELEEYKEELSEKRLETFEGQYYWFEELSGMITIEDGKSLDDLRGEIDSAIDHIENNKSDW